jgi:hypothetical protein
MNEIHKQPQFDLRALFILTAAVPAWLFVWTNLGGMHFGNRPYQPLVAVAGITLVFRILLRDVRNAWSWAILAAPIFPVVVLFIIAVVVSK